MNKDYKEWLDSIESQVNAHWGGQMRVDPVDILALVSRVRYLEKCIKNSLGIDKECSID